MRVCFINLILLLIVCSWYLWNISDDHTSSVIRLKSESQNECFQKAKHVKIYEKQTFLTSWYAHVRVSLFFGNFDVLCFLETPVLRFALLPYYRWLPVIDQDYYYSSFYSYNSEALSRWCSVKKSVLKVACVVDVKLCFMNYFLYNLIILIK